MGSLLRRLARSYAPCFLIWTVLGLFMFSQGLAQNYFSPMPSPWWHYLVTWMTGVWVSAFLTLPVDWLGRRLPFERKNWFRRAVLHLTFSVVFSITQSVLHAIALNPLPVFPMVMGTFGATVALLLLLGFHQNIMGYWTILGIGYALRNYRRYQERERDALRLELAASGLKAELARAQLSALKGQLQPHFLFNTLNAIMVLVRQSKGQEAEDMLARLSDLLRCVLEDVEAQEVPLRRELEYLRLYLSIEEVRYQDRLRVTISADADTLEAALPHMALQPLVENAIRHGIGRSSTAGRMDISASRVNGMLEVKITDDGPGLSVKPATGLGIGLANTRARLQQLYGDAASLTIENGETGGVVATMAIPYHRVPERSESELSELHGFNRIAG